MTKPEEDWVCSVCGSADDLWSHRKLLGPGVVLCGYCRDTWLDGHTEPAEIRWRSLRDRASRRREKMAEKFSF